MRDGHLLGGGAFFSFSHFLEQVINMGHRKTIDHIDTKGNRRIIVSHDPEGFRIDEYKRDHERAPWIFRRNWVEGRPREEISDLISSHW